MRIACIGNMNNIISPTAQYLAKMGHEVDLFLLYEYEHFEPAADYVDVKDIAFNIKKIDMDFAGVMQVPKKDLQKAFYGYDFFIGTDYAPALLARINKRLDYFAWAGTDLFEWPFYSSSFALPHSWECEKMLTAKLQLEGIRNSRYLPMSLNNDFILDAIKKTGSKAKIIYPIPFLYYPFLSKIDTLSSKIIEQVQTLKERTDILLVQQGRQWWKTAPSKLTKGNDIFLKGVAAFVKERPNVKVGIALFEYGADVEESKNLIEELGLSESVIWIPTILRKELLKILKMADIGIGQFGEESWYLYCSNAEIIASQVAYLGHRDDSYCRDKGCDIYPMMNANSSKEIAASLVDYIDHPEKHKNQSKEAFLWLKKYNEESFLTNIKKALEENVKNQLSISSKVNIWKRRASNVLINLANKLVLFSKSSWLKQVTLDKPV